MSICMYPSNQLRTAWLMANDEFKRIEGKTL